MGAGFLLFNAQYLYKSSDIIHLNASNCELSLILSEFEFLAEWKVRRIPKPAKDPPETYRERLKDWVLSSVGVEGREHDIYSYLESNDMATVEELSGYFNMDVGEVYNNLDNLYTYGLIDKMGKAYYIKENLSRAITQRLVPRITESLREIASAESSGRHQVEVIHKMKGRAFSDIGEALVVCKEVERLNGTPVARVVGVKGYNDESVEIEGPVIKYSHHPSSLVILAESGEKIVVGGRHTKGVDVKAHTVIVRGEKDE